MSTIHQKQHLLLLLQQKKSQLKDLQDKCQLQNVPKFLNKLQKKIKLFRKENQDLQQFIEERNQIDTNMLLQSKQLLTNNTKLQRTIEQLKEQLELAKKNGCLSTHKNGNNGINDKQNGGSQSQNKKPSTIKNINRIPSVITLRQFSITQNTLQLDIPNAKIQDHQFLTLEPFVQIKTITINDNLLKNQSIMLICRKFVNLEKLNIANNQFQSQALKQIRNLKNLKQLDIRNNNLGDQSLKHISQLKQKLQDLSCSKNQITDIGAKYLFNLTSLKYLDITNNQIASLGQLIASSIHSHNNQQPHTSAFQKLTHLYLMSNKLNKNNILLMIQNIRSLQFLDVRFNVWTNEEKDQIRVNKKQGLEILC